MGDEQAVRRGAGAGQLERMRRRTVGEQLLAAAEHNRHREYPKSVDQVIGEQRVDELGTALGNEVWAVFLLQALHGGDVAQEQRALPTGIDLTGARDHVLRDVPKQLGDATMGRALVVVGPVGGENLVGLTAEEEVESLLEEPVHLFAGRL